MPGSKRRWPIEPMTEYLDRTGKVIMTIAQQRGADRARADKIDSLYRDGVKTGKLTTTGMDTICIDGLGIHPVEVYGPLYYSTEMDSPRVERKPCERCGGEKSSGDKHLCRECQRRDKNRTCACGCGEPVATPRSLYADRSQQFRVRAA